MVRIDLGGSSGAVTCNRAELVNGPYSQVIPLHLTSTEGSQFSQAQVARNVLRLPIMDVHLNHLPQSSSKYDIRK